MDIPNIDDLLQQKFPSGNYTTAVDNNGGIESNDKWYLGELEAKAVYAGTTQLYPHPETTLFPITIDGVTYEEEDAHIFVANGNEVNLPIPSGTLPKFVAVNGVDVTPTSFVTRTIEVPDLENRTVDNKFSTKMKEVQTTAITANDGDIIHAIFDWDNPSYPDSAPQYWISDILQFGLNEDTGKRNQLKNGDSAFVGMLVANPAAIASLDVSNLTDMKYMFVATASFNQPLSEWDTSNVTNMESMFRYSSFNQDISDWDTSKVTDMDSMFADAISFNSDISGWDTSNVTNMRYMFLESDFNQDISGWDTSNVETMRFMFDGASDFNSDISRWNTSKVTDMGSMFDGASSFNQDLSGWCVSNVEKHGSFDKGATSYTKPRPVWGTCPRGEDIELPDGYELEDCHIFVANGNEVNLPCDGLPTFVAVNGVDVTPTSLTTRTIGVPEIGEDGVTTTTSQEVQAASITAGDGDIIHAIFDWKNVNWLKRDWFSDILQFGLNSATGERNQLNNGKQAFYYMEANPAAIATLDVSNLTNMQNMFDKSLFNQDISGWDVSKVKNMGSVFRDSPFNQDIGGWNFSKVTRMDWMFTGNASFNQDISGWNVSNVTSMNYVFWDASAFNQNLSQWCVSNIGSRPSEFDKNATAWTKPRPVWGTCPRGEDGS